MPVEASSTKHAPTACHSGCSPLLCQVHQELLGDYYHARYKVDFRSLRYPGVISARTLPGGGTTDYAVEIFHAALTSGTYRCFLGPHTALPFLYMPDCLEATYQLMRAPSATLQQVRLEQCRLPIRQHGVLYGWSENDHSVLRSAPTTLQP